MDAGAEAGAISAWALFMTSATPTLIVCILAAVGAALAHKASIADLHSASDAFDGL